MERVYLTCLSLLAIATIIVLSTVWLQSGNREHKNMFPSMLTTSAINTTTTGSTTVIIRKCVFRII